MLDMDPFARYTVERAAKLYKKICVVIETLFTEADIVKYMAPYADRIPYGEVKSKTKSKSKSKSKSKTKKQTRRVNSLELIRKKISTRHTRSLNKKNPVVLNRHYMNNPRYWKKYADEE